MADVGSNSKEHCGCNKCGCISQVKTKRPYARIRTDSKYYGPQVIVLYLSFHLDGLNFQTELAAMASEYGTCPISMEDYDLDSRLPKSLDCRHSLCELCLINKGDALSSCPICREPVTNPDNVPKDLTMMDYLQHKQRRKYLKEQQALRKKLTDLAESAKVELGHIERSQKDRSEFLDGREKLFREHTKSLFKTCLEQCCLKDALKGSTCMSNVNSA